MPIVYNNSIEDPEVFEGVFSRQLVNKNLSGSASITVGELKLKPGATLPAHIHYVEEALIVIQGQGKAVIEDEAYEIKKDMTILVPSGKRHLVTNTGTDLLRIFYSFPAVEVDRVLV